MQTGALPLSKEVKESRVVRARESRVVGRGKELAKSKDEALEGLKVWKSWKEKEKRTKYFLYPVHPHCQVFPSTLFFCENVLHSLGWASFPTSGALL